MAAGIVIAGKEHEYPSPPVQQPVSMELVIMAEP
jgi:hypothetical protein